MLDGVLYNWRNLDFIKSDLFFLQEQLGGLPMCLTESTTQTQNDVLV